MTEDRRALLLSVSEQMYRYRCPCGRCDCVSADPYAIAGRTLVFWSMQYRGLAKAETRRAELYRGFERKSLAADGFRADEHAANASKHEREARRFARATLRYERLARGRKPFVAAEEDNGIEI